MTRPPKIRLSNRSKQPMLWSLCPEDFIHGLDRQRTWLAWTRPSVYLSLNLLGQDFTHISRSIIEDYYQTTEAGTMDADSASSIKDVAAHEVANRHMDNVS